MTSHALFQERLTRLQRAHSQLLSKNNEPEPVGNGIYTRWQNPVVTAGHIPLNWQYDLDPQTNPFLQQRIGVNAAFNAGAIMWQGKYTLVVRVEGNDRKSYFAVCDSDNGIDNFRFWSNPITMPETDAPDTNVYDMRLTHHEDGYVYGLFCTERKDLITT